MGAVFEGVGLIPPRLEPALIVTLCRGLKPAPPSDGVARGLMLKPIPQGLKPTHFYGHIGTNKFVPLRETGSHRVLPQVEKPCAVI
jgi:hypothetical protein